MSESWLGSKVLVATSSRGGEKFVIDLSLVKNLNPNINLNFGGKNKSKGKIIMENVTASDNGGDGVRIEGDLDVRLKDIKSSGNRGEGVNISNQKP